MHADQLPYRELYDRLHQTDGPVGDLLDAWLRSNPDQADWLKHFADSYGPISTPPVADRWRLYALSRVLQILVLRFQTGAADRSPWPGPQLSMAELCSFGERLGLSSEFPATFSPFDCEIVEAVHGTDPLQQITLIQTRWPCFMLGPMLIFRAGTSVQGGDAVFNAAAASCSTLYWAVRRKHRAYDDLSLGWGSNSQWRTEFRRDYRVLGRCFYNVDGLHDLSAQPTGPYEPESAEYSLTPEERIELLIHRCLVSTTKPSDDLWPYHDRFEAAC
jgi:hypothetical protein